MGKISRILGSFMVIVLGVGLLFFSSTGCQEPPTPAELQYLDTLHYALKGNERALNLDPEKLNRRKSQIREEFMPAIRDTFPDLREKLLDDFQGITTTYELFMSKQLLLESSTEILQEELAHLKKETDKGSISREEFKARYRELKQKVDANTLAIEQVAKPVYDLEPMWIRFERKFGSKGAK